MNIQDRPYNIVLFNSYGQSIEKLPKDQREKYRDLYKRIYHGVCTGKGYFVSSNAAMKVSVFQVFSWAKSGIYVDTDPLRYWRERADHRNELWDHHDLDVLKNALLIAHPWLAKKPRKLNDKEYKEVFV